MTDLRKLQKEIYDYGEVERDCARAMQFAKPGGFFHWVFRHIERVARECREEAAAERDEIYRATQEKAHE